MIEYNGITFSNVVELVEYQKAIGVLPNGKDNTDTEMTDASKGKDEAERTETGQKTVFFRAGSSWKPYEDSMLKEAYKNADGVRLSTAKMQELSEKLNRSSGAISHRASYLGLGLQTRKEKIGKISDYVDEKTLAAAKKVSKHHGKWHAPERKVVRQAFKAYKDGHQTKQITGYLSKHLDRTEAAIAVFASKNGYYTEKNRATQVDSDDDPKEEDNGKYMLRKKPKLPVDFDEQRKRTATSAKGKSSIPDFPAVYPVAEESVPQLISLVKHTIANKGQISKFDVESCCQLQESYDLDKDIEYWSGRTWVTFFRQFLLNSKRIADYFGVKNHFKLTEKDGYHYIQYKP